MYKRRIVYLSGYQKEIFIGSAGCISITDDEGECTLDITLRGMGGAESMELCFYAELMENGCEPENAPVKEILINAGTIFLKHGKGHTRIRTQSEDFFGSGLWSDDISRIEFKGQYGTSARWQGKKVIAARRQNVCEPDEISRKTDMDTEETEEQILTGQQEEHTEKMQEAEEKKSEENEKAKNIDDYFRKLPEIKLGTDSRCIACRKLTPDDLAKLPIRESVYAKSSFVLHGYYRHNHILFAKVKNIKENGKIQYAIGVPGVYSLSEEYFAEAFGFTEYRPLIKNNAGEEDFGYWYKYVDTE